MDPYLQHCILSVVLLLHSVPQTDGKADLVVTQAEVLRAEAGQSVTITCSFVSSVTTYSVAWTVGCNDNLSLTEQPYYKRRVTVSAPGSAHTANDLGRSSYEIQTNITIGNLTENDSLTFCCHVENVHGKKGTGNGTRVEVTPKSYTEAPNRDTELFILYVTAGSEAFLIVILLAVVIKYHLQGSSGTADQGAETQLEPQPGLHYSEICNKSRATHPKERHREARVTYATVRVHQ